MNIKTKHAAFLFWGLAVLALVIMTNPLGVLSHFTKETPTPKELYREYTFFATSTAQTNFATTTTAISTNILPWTTSEGTIDTGAFVIAGAEEVTFYFQRGGVTNPNLGKTVFDVDVSADGVTWHDYNRLIGNDVAATATTTHTISAATSTAIFGLDLTNNAFYAVRCVVTETTDGEHSCRAAAVWR